MAGSAWLMQTLATWAKVPIRSARQTIGAFERIAIDAYASRGAEPGGSVAELDPRSIFVLRNNDIGDLLVITPLFEALRRRFPRAQIAAGVGDWAAPALANNPFVDRVLAVNAPWFNKHARGKGPWHRWRYVRRSSEVEALARERFDVGIDVLGSSWGHLLLRRAAIPQRLGVRDYAGGPTDTQRTVPFDPTAHVGRTALRLAELLGASDLPAARPQIFLTAEERREASALWRESASATRRRILIAPGGGAPARRWPEQEFAELASRIAQPQHDVLILSGPGEEMLARRIQDEAPSVRVPEGTLGLRAAFAAVATADVVIANSSMVMHAAAAFEKPTLVLLGPSFPSARAHQRQWGYEGLTVSLGREDGNPMPKAAGALTVFGKMVAAAS